VLGRTVRNTLGKLDANHMLWGTRTVLHQERPRRDGGLPRSDSATHSRDYIVGRGLRRLPEQYLRLCRVPGWRGCVRSHVDVQEGDGWARG
jgi:hypothetical protein